MSDKRNKACVRCRHQKIKCQLSPGAPACQKCIELNVECVFGLRRKDDFQWKKETDLRLQKIDDNIEQLFAILKGTNVNVLSVKPGEALFSFDFYIPANDEQKCLAFFQDSLSRYLPIFIFDYIPRISHHMKDTSPLLYLAVISVSSLYLTDFEQYFGLLIDNLQACVLKLSPNKIFDDQGVPYNFDKTLYDLLGCIITSAWLGNDLGAKCSLIASDLAGRLNPPILDKLNLSQQKRKAAFAFNLASYIIERRLQISYTSSEYVNIRNYMAKRRDYFLPHYLDAIFSSHSDSKVYKLRANVELCTMIMIFHDNLSSTSNNINDDKILEWSNKLNQWLAEWIGKLFTSLETSSAKPLLLTFHFTKMFLYIQALNANIPKLEMNEIIYKGENTAIDIIDMLIMDEDIRRLIKIGPVFYPTIFVTATALLLKIISISPKFGYRANEKLLISKAEEAHAILLRCITSPFLPSFVAIQSLKEGIEKAKINMDTVSLPHNLNAPDILELMNGFIPITNTSPQDSGVADYSRLWATDIFDPDNFELNGFTTEMMKSISEPL